jgi:hypothetical protein
MEVTKVTGATLGLKRPVSCRRNCSRSSARAVTSAGAATLRHGFAPRIRGRFDDRLNHGDPMSAEQFGPQPNQSPRRWRTDITASLVRVLAWSFSMMRLT